jgi:hypothetical protein
LHSIDDIIRTYQRHVNLPWQADTPAAARIWVVWYDKSLQRRLTARLGEFEQVTRQAGHGWHSLNIAPLFPKWLAQHEFFESLMEHPAEIRGLLPDLEDYLVKTITKKLQKCSEKDVLALDGCGAFFGMIRLSSLLNRVASEIPGRLLVGFPGKYSSGVYRLLDARDGWNYHAIPIPAEVTL